MPCVGLAAWSPMGMALHPQGTQRMGREGQSRAAKPRSGGCVRVWVGGEHRGELSCSGGAGPAPLPGVCFSVPAAKSTCHSKQPHICLPRSPALVACPSWLQMDRLGAGQEQTELLGARDTLSRFGAAHRQSKPGIPGCLLQTDLQHHTHPLNSLFIWHRLPSSLESSSVLAASTKPSTMSSTRWGKQNSESSGTVPHCLQSHE